MLPTCIKKCVVLAGGAAQVVEHVLIKCEALSSNTSTTKKKGGVAHAV
jgi:hypothetical protein